ncbi:hypothetical protein H9P43_001854 [Blastocladiella emersonii ATCC 22665]|nr:hypothetical protein H9P43_001854 [Blastocladiella emersonii ATCC 22665]
MPNVDLINLKRYETQQSDKETSKAWDDGSVEKLFEAQNLAKTKLKQIVRRGVPDGIRSLVWPEFLKMHKMPEYDKNYTKALFRVHGSKPPESVALCPQFGGSLFPDWLCLTPKGFLVAGRLLSILAYDYPHIEYCPFLPVIVVLLLHHVGPDDTLGSINWMIKRTLVNHDVWTTFPTYKRDIKALNHAFAELVKSTLSKVWKHIELLNNTDKPLWARWFCDFFIGVLPLDVIFHIMDSFLIEGHKVLLRYALALLESRSAAVLACVAWDDVRACFLLEPPKPKDPSAAASASASSGNNAQKLPSPVSPTVPTNVWTGAHTVNAAALTKSAFAYKFSKKKLLEWRNAYHASKPGAGGHREGSLTDLIQGLSGTNVELPRLLHSEASAFMTTEDWAAVWKWVPARHKVAALELAFTTRKHGRALATFYDLCREREPTLLFIETMDGSVFGAFCPASWPLSNRDFQKFFGTGETFVFTLKSAGHNAAICFPWIHATPTGGSAAATTAAGHGLDLNVADSTNSFMWAGPNELIIGGGGKGQAIWIDKAMSNGWTATCSTFNNAPLAPTPKFEISVIEVFSFRITT